MEETNIIKNAYKAAVLNVFKLVSVNLKFESDWFVY